MSRGWTPEVLDVGPTTTPRGGGGGGGGSLGGKSGRGCRTPTGLSERVASSMERSQSGTPESACRLVLRRPFMAPTLPCVLLDIPLTMVGGGGGGGGSFSWPKSMPLEELHLELRLLVSSDEATEGDPDSLAVEEALDRRSLSWWAKGMRLLRICWSAFWRYSLWAGAPPGPPPGGSPQGRIMPQPFSGRSPPVRPIGSGTPSSSSSARTPTWLPGHV